MEQVLSAMMGNSPLAVALVVAAWRFDKRLSKIEIIFKDQLK